MRCVLTEPVSACLPACLPACAFGIARCIVTHPPAEGVFHGAEVRFTFFDEDQLVGWDEKGLSVAMVRYWTNFAASGNPNLRPASSAPHSPDSLGVHPWPPYARTHGGAVDFKLPKEKVVSHIHTEQCDFWDTQPYM
jgi:carboxylesterase type B